MYNLKPDSLYVIGYVRPLKKKFMKDGWLDWLVRMRFLCEVSHVALAMGDSKIEAWIDGLRMVHDLKTGYEGCYGYACQVDPVQVPLSLQQEIWTKAVRKALAFENEKIEYDLTGAIGRGLNKDWDDPKKLFCSEFTCQAFMDEGIIDKKSGIVIPHKMAPHQQVAASYLLPRVRIDFK